MPRNYLFVAAVLAAWFVCVLPARAADLADMIYHGGDIVTVDDKSPMAEALAVKDGKIAAVGKKADVLALKGDSTKVVDLNGTTLIPGFVDGHSHFINCLQVSHQANCFAPPAGPGKSIKDIIEVLRVHQKKLGVTVAAPKPPS